MAKGIAGRKPIPITEMMLQKLERLGASGISQRLAAMAIGMDVGTFIDKKRDYPNFATAWQKGREQWAEQISRDAKAVYEGLLKNATLPTPFNPHGSTNAQLGYLDKVMGRFEDEQPQSQIPGQEVREVIFRITTDAKPGRT